MRVEWSRSVSSLRLLSVIQTTLDGLRMPHARLICPAGFQSFLAGKTRFEALAFRRVTRDGWSGHHTMARGANKNGLPSHNRGCDRRDLSGEPRAGECDAASDREQRGMGSDGVR